MISRLTKRILNIYILTMLLLALGAGFVGAAGRFAYTLHNGPSSSVRADGQPEVQLTDVANVAGDDLDAQ